jgi:multidrug efflux system outer membrane protein
MEPHYVRPTRPCRRHGRPATPISPERGDAARGHYPDIFRDPRLQALIAQALANNRDLMVAAANIAPPASSIASSAPRSCRSSTPMPAESPVLRRIGQRRQSRQLSGRCRRAELRARPVRPAALAHHASSKRYFATEAAARVDPADAGRRHRQTPGSTYARIEPAADRRRRRDTREERAPHPPAAEGGIVPRTDLRQASRSDARPGRPCAAAHAVAQDVNLLQLLVGAPIDPTLLPGSIDEAAPTDRDVPAGSIPMSCCVGPTCPGGISAARGECRDRRARAGAVPEHSLTGLLGFAAAR